MFLNQIEPYQVGGDDTALNGIMLTCEALEDGRFGGNIVSNEGPWGTWDTGPVMCDQTQGTRHFLTSFTLQVEPSQVVFCQMHLSLLPSRLLCFLIIPDTCGY